jgi:hypothetical protein
VAREIPYKSNKWISYYINGGFDGKIIELNGAILPRFGRA